MEDREAGTGEEIWIFGPTREETGGGGEKYVMRSFMIGTLCWILVGWSSEGGCEGCGMWHLQGTENFGQGVCWETCRNCSVESREVYIDASCTELLGLLVDVGQFNYFFLLKVLSKIYAQTNCHNQALR